MRRSIDLSIGRYAVVLGLLLVLLACGGTEEATSSPDEVVVEPDAIPITGPMQQIEIFFPRTSGVLGAEIRDVPVTDDSTELARSVLRQLIQGPTSERHYSGLPVDLEVGNVVIEAGGRIYIDFVSSSHPTPPPSGSHDEYLAVYSIVNSLTRNVSSVDSVVILWNGRQPQTFGGHVDTAHPLLPLSDPTR